MSNLLELRKISIEFRRLSSNFLKTTDDDNFLYVKRLHTYIENQSVIQAILNYKIANSEYDCEQFIVQTEYGHEQQINVPIDEADHIKAMQHFLCELATCENNRLFGIANSFGFTNSRKFNDIIQAFLEKVFKPLIDFIVDSLSKEMMTLEQTNPNTQFSQHIENNYGTANVGEKIKSSNATNQNNVDEVLKRLNVLRTEATNALDNEEEKASVDECLEVIEGEVKSGKPKRSMIKTAISTLQAIKGSAKFAAEVVALVQFFQEILR